MEVIIMKEWNIKLLKGKKKNKWKREEKNGK